ncbi:MAG: ABC transporter permease [Elusimicrobia bacterium]|nr:ABC transporter permease [Elusimicrobiota bacterium]
MTSLANHQPLTTNHCLIRIWAVLLRHLYLYPKSASRIMEIFYWPVLDLLVWGFLTLYIVQHPNGISRFSGYLLGAMIFWDMLFRSQQAISISFLEEVWSRNLLNLFTSPLKPIEFLLATMTLSFVKLLTAGAVTVFLAWAFFSFNLFKMGTYLFPFVLNLVAMGWAVGIVTTAIILRYGERAEVMAWGLALLIQPFAAVFYPVSVLPWFLKPVALALPATYIFEGMREVLMAGNLNPKQIWIPTLLNGFYLFMAFLFFKMMFQSARIHGRLTKLGE